MAPTYYVIELTARWLTVLLVALALVMVLAFAFGYGAAWSVLGARQAGPAEPVLVGGATPTPTPEEVMIADAGEPPTPEAMPTRAPTATPVPPTATPKPKPTKAPAKQADGFWVQVVAVSSKASVERTQAKLAEQGFTRDRQQVEETTADGNVLHRLRVGPFPDRDSAERVATRMKAAGYSGAFVVAP
jgi:cell division septation protein DedD